MATANEPVPERAMYRVEEACRLLSLSRSEVYEQIRAGRLRTVKQGRARRVPAEAIEKYVQLLVTESEGAHGQAA